MRTVMVLSSPLVFIPITVNSISSALAEDAETVSCRSSSISSAFDFTAAS